jgi:hypothetical protein
MKQTTVLIVMLLVMSTLTAIAQPRQRHRTAEFEKLNIFIGKWQTEGKVYPGEGVSPIETGGEVAFEWVMNKTWLMWNTGDGRLSGYGFITWDNEEDAYHLFWFDNLLTRPSEYQGNWEDSQTLVFHGKMHIQGKRIAASIIWKFISKKETKIMRKVSTDGINFSVRHEASWRKKK